MCGIFGYIGSRNAVKTAIEGLKRLEYRGYDSAGIAGIHEGKIVFAKNKGKVATLEKKVEEEQLEAEIVIAHTRWATHGVPSEVNAHPQFDATGQMAIVHNGIIENQESLRHSLQEQGFTFTSETDTEVVAKLIGSLYEGDILEAVKKTMPLLRGAYAIALIHQDYPDQILAFVKDMPLVVGVGKDEVFLASDSHAFAAHTHKVIFLENEEIAVIRAQGFEVYDLSLMQVEKEMEQLAASAVDVTKGDFEHYTLKEIYEQPQTLRNALASRFIEDYGTAVFEEPEFDANLLVNVERILILACGTSWHAGYIAAYIIESKARIPVQLEISSEFRYKNPIVQPGTLVIAISQSGETADTLAAVRELRAKGATVLALCNVQGSALTREANATLYLHAGREIGVCSTKAFTNQIGVLALLTLMLARMRNMDKYEGQEFLHALLKMPDVIQRVLDQVPSIQVIAKKYARYDNFFFVGRSYMYPVSLEGALKLKEISYINANGYPAGEMKHGPIALISKECPTVALCANKHTYDKMLSNLMEIKARSGKVIAIAEASAKGLEKIADEIIRIPDTIDPLAVIPSVVVTQLLAYYIAKERGTEIDQPRNLAKSVTVE